MVRSFNFVKLNLKSILETGQVKKIFEDRINEIHF